MYNSDPIVTPQNTIYTGTNTPNTALARHLAGTDNFNVDHLQLALAEMQMAAPGYQDAEDYYDGKSAEYFAHPKIAKILKRTANKYKVNFAKTPVNVVADRLAISSVTVKHKTQDNNATDTNTDADDLTKRFDAEVWTPAELEQKTKTAHKRASEFGDAYLFVWPETAYDEDTDSHVATNKPCVYYNSPKSTRAIYDPENPDIMLFVIKRFKAIDGRLRANLYYKGRIEHLVLKTNIPHDSKDTNDAKSWETFQPSTENPFDRIPIFHYRNDTPYGVPEHYDGYGPQDAVNKIANVMVHSTEFMGFPQRYGLAEPNATLAGGTFNPDWDDEEDATEPDDANTEEQQAGPGTLLKLQGITTAGTFEQAEAKGFLEPMEFYVRALAQTCTTPLRYFYPPGAHPPSGESYRAEDTPLINKVKDRQRSYRSTHQHAFAFCMEIATDGKLTAEDFAVEVKWAPAASIDDALGWETVQKKIDAGVPRRQALIEAGYTAEQVDSWLQTNEDKAEFQRDVETFSLLAAAAKNFADTGAQNGMNPEAVGILLTHYAQRLLPKDAKKLPLPEKQEPTPDTDPTNPAQDMRDGIVRPPRLDLPPGSIQTRQDSLPSSG